MELPLRVLILDGHPDEQRLVSSLLDHYAASLEPDATVQRIAVRDLAFDPNLRRGYGTDQAWEPDLEQVGAALDACDHLVVGFPLWWGGEPMLLKGLLDRILLPGFAFRYRRQPVLEQAVGWAVRRRACHDGHAALVSAGHLW